MLENQEERLMFEEVSKKFIETMQKTLENVFVMDLQNKIENTVFAESNPTCF